MEAALLTPLQPFLGASEFLEHLHADLLALVETSQQPFHEEAPFGPGGGGDILLVPCAASKPILPLPSTLWLLERTLTSYAAHAPASAGGHQLPATLPQSGGARCLPPAQPHSQ